MIMKKFIQKTLILFLLISLVPQMTFAQFVRENNFVDKKGAERTANIKKFQATMNIPISGTLDNKTKEALYNKDYKVWDMVTNPPSKGYWIAVNKSRRILTMYMGDKSLGKYPVTLGTSATQTPSGRGKIGNMHKNPAWGGMNGKYKPVAADDPKNPLGERWMGLSLKGFSGYGIHGNIKPHQIGGYYSNGCIRMFNYDIEEAVFPQMKIGNPVWIGTDTELESWGLYQFSKVEKDKAVEKPQATQQNQTNDVENEEKIENYQAVDLFEY